MVKLKNIKTQLHLFVIKFLITSLESLPFSFLQYISGDKFLLVGPYKSSSVLLCFYRFKSIKVNAHSELNMFTGGILVQLFIETKWLLLLLLLHYWCGGHFGNGSAELTVLSLFCNTVDISSVGCCTVVITEQAAHGPLMEAAALKLSRDSLFAA